MATRERQERMRPEKRRELVVAAAEEFAAHGFEQASVNRILARCRMSKSSLYHVVDSKAALLDLVVRDLTGAVTEHWAPPAPADFADDFWRTTEQMLSDLAELAVTDADLGLLGRVFYLSVENEAADQVFVAVRRWLGQVLAVGRASGEVDDSLPADLQAQVVFAVLRAFDEWTLRQPADMAALLASGLADHQAAAIRRLLAPSAAPA